MYCLFTGKRKISVENITFYLLYNFVPFARPQSGTVITQLKTVLVNTGTATPKLFSKQSSGFIFTTKNRMSQCTYFENDNSQ